MTGTVLVFAFSLLVAAPAADETAADRVVLKDGSTVLGLITSWPNGPRGSVQLLVRRDWAERNAKARLAEWDRAASVSSRKAIEQRRERLASWRRERERSPDVGPDDRILRWIDAEQKRLADPDAAARAPLIPVRLSESEVVAFERRPVASSRLLCLAWTGGVRDPESMNVAELTDAVESRGFVVDPKGAGRPVSLDRLLPPAPEPRPPGSPAAPPPRSRLIPGSASSGSRTLSCPTWGPGSSLPTSTRRCSSGNSSGCSTPTAPRTPPTRSPRSSRPLPARDASAPS